MASLNLLAALRIGSRGITGRGSRLNVSTLLVIAQIGLSVVVITAAGLMLHSLFQLSRVDPGFRTAGTVTAELALDSSACRTKGRCLSFYQTVLDRLHGLAGVQGVALTDSLPLSGRDNNYVYDAEGHPRDARQGAALATGRTVSAGYFDVLGLRLQEGRLLNEQDTSGATRAVVINQRMAQRLWPNQDPVGKHLLDVNDAPAPAIWDASRASIVVGVVRNAREGSIEGEFEDEVYLPMTPAREHPVMDLVVRTYATPAQVAPSLRRVVEEVDSQVPMTRVRSMDEVVASSAAAPRALAILLLGFGAIAVLIGAVGVYSLIAYMVSWRTREIGLRLALGAQKWQIVRAVVRHSVLLAAAGCVAGLAGAIALGRVMRSFLFGVSPLDPLTFCAVPLLMIFVSILAAWLPARRAAAIDPMQALRAD